MRPFCQGFLSSPHSDPPQAGRPKPCLPCRLCGCLRPSRLSTQSRAWVEAPSTAPRNHTHSMPSPSSSPPTHHTGTCSRLLLPLPPQCFTVPPICRVPVAGVFVGVRGVHWCKAQKQGRDLNQPRPAAPSSPQPVPAASRRWCREGRDGVCVCCGCPVASACMGRQHSLLHIFSQSVLGDCARTARLRPHNTSHITGQMIHARARIAHIRSEGPGKCTGPSLSPLPSWFSGSARWARPQCPEIHIPARPPAPHPTLPSLTLSQFPLRREVGACVCMKLSLLEEDIRGTDFSHILWVGTELIYVYFSRIMHWIVISFRWSHGKRSQQ